MSIKLHWFLPTTGDARGLVGGGHSVPQGVGRPRDEPAPPTTSASPTSTTSPRSPAPPTSSASRAC